MKKLFVLLGASVLIAAILPMMVVAGSGGFDEFGYNYKARIFNGWFGYYDRSFDGWVSGTGDSWLIMKWSKDWIPKEDEPIGAWVTNHFIWYSNDYSEDTWYGWYTRVQWTDKDVTPNATYMITEFLKIQKVSDDEDAWNYYQSCGAYDAGWGTYDNGVPKYVVFQDVIDVYDVETGNLVAHFDLCTASPKGLGQPIF